jgi:hypothetical protein
MGRRRKPPAESKPRGRPRISHTPEEQHQRRMKLQRLRREGAKIAAENREALNDPPCGH